ncbi:MAG: CdaR family protein [Bryobacteraceae bacterium]
MMAFFRRDLGWKLFSLVVAGFLWITYARDPEIGAFVSAPVEYKGMPEDLEIGSDVAGTVSLDLRGAAERVRNFSAARSSVVLDFAGINQPGEHTFQIDNRNVSLPQGLRLVRAIPAQLRFTFEQKIRREVPVEVRFGAPDRGYGVSRYEASPEKLIVVGPETRTRRIETAVTDPIDLTGVVGRMDFRVNAFVDDPQVRFLNPGKVSVRVYVEKK